MSPPFSARSAPAPAPAPPPPAARPRSPHRRSPQHPGGAKVLVAAAGTDCTDDYEMLHAPGTLEKTLDAKHILGTVAPKAKL